MIDTSPVTEEKYRVMLMSRSPAERLRMAGRMLGSAKKLITAGILSQKGPQSETEMKLTIFKRLYQDDFSDSDLQKIMRRIQEA